MSPIELIAEIGQNHNGDIVLAKELIFAAKENGAEVAKFQVFDALEVFGEKGNEWYEYNCQTQLNRDQVFELASECANVGIEFLATPFDVHRVQWLEEVGVKRYKVASRSIHQKKLIEAIMKTNKPAIISLGFWEGKEFPLIKSQAPLHFLYCVSKYPTEIEDLDFNKINFNKYAGFSDHTIGKTATLIAMCRGARIIEKHFTLDKKMYGPDHSGSMEPSELKEIHEFRNDLMRCLKYK